ncbi:MAG: B-box zinc finger protein [Verrucomicrobiota bacterium]
MKCFNHPSVDAVALCKSCSRALCRECVGEVDVRTLGSIR